MTDAAPLEDPTEAVARRVAEGAEERLADIEYALSRLDDASYGRCEVCGRPIESERLAQRPSARRCVAHLAAMDATA